MGIRLYPPPTTPVNEEIYAEVEVPSSRDGELPYVIINMVSSVDGRSAVSGKASSLGGGADRRAMRVLRSKVDAVMIGAATLRAEKLSLGLDEEGSREQGSQPLAVIVSGSGSLPLEKNLIAREGQCVLILRPEKRCLERSIESAVAGKGSAAGSGGRVWSLIAPADPEGRVDLREALKLLAQEYSVKTLLVEGGPTLNYALVSRGLADELFLTIAPKLVAGNPRESLAILEGPPLENVGASLISAYLVQQELFLRYSLNYPRRDSK